MSHLSHPKVSVVVPLYQSAATIGHTLDSVESQRFKDWECIVVNDGSTDNGPEIVRPYVARNNRFRLIEQANRGLSAARNAGVGAATGTYLHFLDADDWIHRDALREMVTYLELHPDVSVCHTDYNRTDQAGRVVQQKTAGRPFAYESYLVDPFPPVAALTRASMIPQIGLFDEELRTWEDMDFWMRAYRAGATFGYVAGHLAYYRWLPESNSRKTERKYRGAVRFYEQLRRRDDRVTAPSHEFANGFPDGVIQRCKVGMFVSCLAASLVRREEELTREIVQRLEEEPDRELVRVALISGSFAAGFLEGCGRRDAGAVQGLSSVIAAIAPEVFRLQERFQAPGLFASLLDYLLTPLQQATSERDRLRASTSYRLGRAITRFKPW